MELATCNDIEVDVVLLRTEEGVANSTACGRGSCDRTLAWHSNTHDPRPRAVKLATPTCTTS
jgi:hypothetical protein